MRIFERIQKTPFILKLIFWGAPILIPMVYSMVLNNKSIQNKREFYKNEISSIVLSSSTSSTGRATEFILSNGLKIYFGILRDHTIQIGDSIYRESNTYRYGVFGKDVNGDFKYWNSYNFEETF